ncbi:MAG TPA: MMPL family transporter [Chloroflexota bacterium]|nr:MMPL family transporter [Chloroflexota bacterium]
MTLLTRWVLAHKRIVVVLWLVLTVVGFATAGKATNALSLSFALPGKEGYDVSQQIVRQYGNGGTSNPIAAVITLPSGTTVDSPGIRPQLAAAFTRLAAVVPNSRLVSWANTSNNAFVSADRHTTFALLDVYTPPDFSNPPWLKGLQATAGSLSVAGAGFHLTGQDLLRTVSGGGGGPGVFTEALLGGLGALIVLAVVFGSFLAVIPLLMAIVAIPTTFLLVWGLATATDISFIVEFLISLIGLGVAIDYSLLVVLRWREERLHGLQGDAAVQRAMETSGAAVVFSGTTVAVGLLALIALPVPFLRSVGYGGMLIPLVSVAVATTLLPVLLATVGSKLDWPRRTRSAQASAFWTGWAQLIVRRRWIAAGVAVLILAALVSPLGRIVVGDPSADSLASSGDAYTGLVALEHSGIGPGPLDTIEVLAPRAEVTAAQTRLQGIPGTRGVVAPDNPSWRRGDTALLAVILTSDGSTSDGRAAIDRVRAAAHTVPGVRIGGNAAYNEDFVSAVYGNFPLMLALIVGLSFILLARAFRSLLLPLKAVLLNLVSLGASWGVLVLIWQDGHGSSAIWGIPATGSITSWIPVMVFAFLFGLSMDYEVFILSRIREEYDASGSTPQAIVEGIGRTGRLVTSAAIILFLAFVSLGSSPGTEIKILATGLAVGILLDATVIRMLLVPALLSLFGRWNWWLPVGVARVLRVEPSPLAPRGGGTITDLGLAGPGERAERPA